MEKKTYLRPTLKSVDVELQNVIAESNNSILWTDSDDDATTDIRSKLWSSMGADANAAAKSNEEEDNL